MPYKLTVDLPHLADGAEVYIEGLGNLTKGDNVVSDEDAAAYETANIGHEDAIALDYDEEGQPIEGTEHVVGQSQVRYSFVDLVERYAGLSAEEVAPEIDEEVEEKAAEEPAPKPVTPLNRLQGRSVNPLVPPAEGTTDLTKPEGTDN